MEQKNKYMLLLAVFGGIILLIIVSHVITTIIVKINVDKPDSPEIILPNAVQLSPEIEAKDYASFIFGLEITVIAIGALVAVGYVVKKRNEPLYIPTYKK